ncbi:hypothetical protein [Hymenobacter sp. YC55]|uniref:hypothetical protein n=1 Tax=Hymenobacter sp. YC55 TaxID=3034019 RepID=UPI0023F6814B|nr:hypothetical protein [Hymenobacter sp. YC55]MDF7815409.1 hypothetical protein [Hymenobacter sp. YC55]
MIKFPHQPLPFHWLAAISLLAILTLSVAHPLPDKEYDKTFQGADFRVSAVEEARLGGVNVTGVHRIADLNSAQRGQWAAIQPGESLPLQLQIEVGVRNPSREPVTLTEVAYQTVVDGQVRSEGRETKPVKIAEKGGISIMVLQSESDVRQLLASASAVEAFAVGLADQSRQLPRVSLRVKPVFAAGRGQRIVTADWLVVGKNFPARNILDESKRRP